MNGRPTALMDRALRETTALLGDGELLRRYADVGDECAFAAVVERHAAMVMGVCRRLLPTPADAEDACQAVFLVLCRKAGSVAWRPSAAGWLYETARKVARNARDAAARRARHERAAVSVRPPRTGDEPWSAALDEELERLPAKYREPLVLCYLEGLTRDEAAARLGVPAATLKSRLERGRRRLAEALSRRGGEFGSALLATAATNQTIADPRWVKSIMAAVGGSPTRAAAALALEAGMRAWTMKSICTAVAVAAMAGVGLGMGRPETPAAPKAKPPVVKVDRFGDPLPDGAAMRLGTVSFRSAGLAGVGFREGGELVTLGAEPRVQTWSDAGRVKLGGEMPMQNEPPNWRRTISTDGRFVATERGRRVVVWDVSEDEPIEYASREVSGAYSMAFSPNGEWLAVNQTARDVTENLLLFHLPKLRWYSMEIERGSLDTISFSSDNKTLAVTKSMTGVTIVIDATTRRVVRRIMTRREQPEHAALSADGRTLAVLPRWWRGEAEQVIRTFDVRSGRRLSAFDSGRTGADWVAFSPDGRTLWGGGITGVSQWDPATGKLLRRIAGPASRGMAFGPNGKRFATYSEDAVLLWDAVRDRAIRPEVIDAGHSGAIMGVAVSPDGKVIATDDIHRNIRLWDARTGTQIGATRGGGSNHTPEVVFLPDSKSLIAVGISSVTPIVFDALTGKELRRITLSKDTAEATFIKKLRLTPDGKTLTGVAVSYRDGHSAHSVRWDVTSGKEIDRVALPRDWSDDISCPSRSPDGLWEVQGGHIRRVGKSEIVAVVPGTYPFNWARFSADSRFAAIHSDDSKLADGTRGQRHLTVFDLPAGKPVVVLPTGDFQRHTISADGRRVAVFDKIGPSVWDVASGVKIWTARTGPDNMVRPSAIAFTPDGKRLVTGHGCSALVWDLP